MSAMTGIRLLTVILSLTMFAALTHANTDVVIFQNGDRLTGEVKSLEKGLLRFKNDATGTISIEWDDIAFVSSDQNIRVETQEGLRFFGHVLRSAEEFVVTVETTSGPFELESHRVVGMTPIKETAIGRFDGEVYAGYDFAKATKVQQLNIGFDVDYRTEFRSIALEGNATTSDSGEVETSQRLNLNFDYRRLRPNRWLRSALIRLSRNDELGIDLRTSVGLGGGRIIKQTNATNLILEGGLAYSSENVSGGIESNQTWEAYGRLGWDWFRYDLPELNLSTNLLVFPSITDNGRVRGDFDISFRWEFIDDFFWRLSFYESYDNKPNDPTAEKTDYGINTSVVWDF
jgi:hypothetical protein